MKLFSVSDIRAIREAVNIDPTIQTSPGKLHEAPGVTADYLHELGISKGLLRKLETWGLAKRGYLREKSGYKAKWILVNPEAPDAVEAEVPAP